MADPLRLRLLKSLTTLLQGITPANGYAFDLSASVFRGRTEFGDSDPFPCVTILEPPIQEQGETASRDSAKFQAQWNLMVQGFINTTEDTPIDEVYLLCAEVRKRVAEEVTTNGRRGVLFGERKVSEMKMLPAVVRPPDEMSSHPYFLFRLVLVVAEDDLNPYG